MSNSSITLKKARRARTGTFVTIPGPCFIHENATTDTYSDFYHEVAKALGLKQPQIMFGSDQEQAIRNGAKMIFSHGLFFYCEYHLRENMKDDLKTIDAKDRNKILCQVFGKNTWGEDGLTSSIDIDDFNKRKIDINRYLFPGNKFSKYMEKLHENLEAKWKSNGAVTGNFSSNPVESMNKVTKGKHFSSNFSLQKTNPIPFYRFSRFQNRKIARPCGQLK